MSDPALRWLACAVFSLVSIGCATGSVSRRFQCEEDLLAQWQIPAGWLDHELTPTQARVEVLTANLSKPSAEARWQALREVWREGDEYWLYRRSGEETMNALGIQRGVVLLRGCEQLGFATTRIEAEPHIPPRP